METPGLCADCNANAPWTDEHNGLRYGPEGFRCAGPLHYRGTVRGALLNLKFEGVADIAEPFGKLLAECAAERFYNEFDLVTWVPLSAARKRRRGYDQSERMAVSACAVWGVRPECTLMKRVENAPQARIKGPDAARRRRENVRGVYAPVPDIAVQGRRILLLDDICTSGETLREASRVLRRSGAATVVCATLALAGNPGLFMPDREPPPYESPIDMEEW